jgi:hypothetical protein
MFDKILIVGSGKISKKPTFSPSAIKFVDNFDLNINLDPAKSLGYKKYRYNLIRLHN